MQLYLHFYDYILRCIPVKALFVVLMIYSSYTITVHLDISQWDVTTGSHESASDLRRKAERLY